MLRRALLWVGILCLVACGKTEKPSSTKGEEVRSTIEMEKKDIPKEGTVKEEKKEIEEKQEEKSPVEGWVKTASFSEGKNHRFPWLNEEVLGEVAVQFNKETEEKYAIIKENFEGKEEETFLSDSINYQEYLDENANTYSLVASSVGVDGDEIYRSLVVDLTTKKPISLQEGLKRIGFTESEMIEEVKKYYATIYASSPADYLQEGEVDLEMEDYLAERLAYFENSVKEEVPEGTDKTHFAIEKGRLNLYMVVRIPGYGVFFYRPFYVRKDVVENAVLNGNYQSILAKVTPSSEKESLGNANIVKKITTEATGEEYHFISLRDGVKIRLSEVEYDEKKNEMIEKNPPIYEGVLKKGEVVSLDTVVPEGIPNLKIYAEYDLLNTYTEEYEKIVYESELSYNGRYAPPLIEYLDGK